MVSKKSIYFIGIAILSICVGFASARMMETYRARPINIFEQTRLETPGLKWVKDSTLAIRPFRIEGELTFAGEHVPLEELDVHERLDRELQINVFRQANTLLNMKLANRYFPEIERILIEEGVPTDFKYLPLIESDLREVVSPAGAAGFWQFLSSTGKTFGLEINESIDERYNIEKATHAACQYLKLAHNKLGSWTAAAASYNYGIEGIMGKLQSQHTSSYYDLVITSETSRYVFRALAMKVIFANPEQAGYYIRESDLYMPYQYALVQIDSSVSDLPSLATQMGVKYRDLKAMNGWLRSASLPNRSQKGYLLRLPKH
jgi:membrane-bound lytic murein transglycosylase D